jgi:hypothetical protein
LEEENSKKIKRNGDKKIKKKKDLIIWTSHKKMLKNPKEI